MHSGEWLLDQVAFNQVQPRVFWRVHPATVGSPPHPCDPRDANSSSRARLSLCQLQLPNGGCVAMFYVATSAAGALFEDILRRAKIYPGQRVACVPDVFVNRCLSKLELQRRLEFIPLGLPDRKIVVTSQTLDARWREIISTSDHGDTHAAALAVYEQVAAAGKTLTGVSWPSVQAPPATVFLFYAPPHTVGDWCIHSTVALDTPAGPLAIASALAQDGYTWIGDPTGPTYDPIAGCL